jgi:hypothetical protein
MHLLPTISREIAINHMKILVQSLILYASDLISSSYEKRQNFDPEPAEGSSARLRRVASEWCGLTG